MKLNYSLLIFAFFTLITSELYAYPIDGYTVSGIRRLLYLQLVEKEDIKGKKSIAGAKKSIEDIKLHLHHTSKGDSLQAFPTIDANLQKDVNRLFPNMHESYAISLLEITEGRPIRYAERKGNNQYQPGSVGKLAVITAFFTELARVYPYCFPARQELLKSKSVRAGSWAIYDEHTVPIFDTASLRLTKRQVRESDIFSLYEWADHMMSVSNNGAAAVVWREAILMHIFGPGYADLTEEQANDFFKNTPKSELAEISRIVVNEPLRKLGIVHEEWRLGTMFTRGATRIVPRKGGSTGTPKGLMKWMLELEKGDIVDAESSLEIKRLMYMTGRRIRYAASAAIREAGVYFKSGSLYSCNRDLMPNCGKYRGNVKNYMNSVAIIEKPDGTTYLVALMSNVLKKNSAYDHLILAQKIDKLMTPSIQ